MKMCIVRSTLISLLLCSYSSAQWSKTSLLDSLGLTPGQRFSSAFALSGTNLFAATVVGLYLSSDEGNTWTQRDQGGVRSLALSGENLLQGTKRYTGISETFLSRDIGLSWTYVCPAAIVVASGTNVLGRSMDYEYPDGYGSTIVLSTDCGVSWTTTNLSSRWSGSLIGSLTSIAIRGPKLFAGVTSPSIGGEAKPSGVYLSTDGGIHWTQSNAGLADTNVMFLNSIGTSLYASTVSNRVFRSTDEGTSWFPATLTGVQVTSFAERDSNLFAGTTNGGIFLSTNNGASWASVNEGLTDTIVNALCASGTYLFAGTWGAGVWRRPLSEMITSIGNPLTELPTQFSLKQNYPNPFNPTTVVNYQLSVASDVKLMVFDILGREVAVLVNEKKASGSYEVKFDASGLGSGVYLYRLTAGSFVQTRKMLLVK